MNLRSLPLWHSLSVITCAILLSVPQALAVAHNPANQPPESVQTTDVTITSVTATVDEEGEVTVSVIVDRGNHSELLDTPYAPAVAKAYKQGESTPIDGAEANVTGSGDVTLTFPILNCGCSIEVKVTGLAPTAGSPSETPPFPATITPADSSGSGGSGISGGGGGGSGGDKSAGGVRIESPLGSGEKSDGGGSGGGAGKIEVNAKRPTPQLYTPEGLRLIGNPSMSEQIYDGGGSSGSIRQVVGKNQITDIQTTGVDSYEMRVYDIGAKGSQTSQHAPYSINTGSGQLLRTVKVENPGKTVVTSTSDPQLYEQARYDKKLTYALPLADNNYTVQLFLSEPFYSAVGQATFDVTAQGTTVLPAYDLYQAAGGKNKARVESFSAAVNNGTLSLALTAQKAVAHVSAIKVISAGGTVAGTTPDASLYSSSRLGEFTWQGTVPNGTYNVALYFAEPVYAASGKRLFNVWANGVSVLANYDIYASAGGTNIARQETIPVTVTNGLIDLQFVKVTGDPRLCALSVTDVSTGTVVLATNAGGSAYTATGGTVFSADAGFTGGVADQPGRVVLAIKAGSGYTASDGTVFASDQSYVDSKKINGYVVDGSLTRLKVTKSETGRAAEVSEFNWATDPETGTFGEIALGDSLRQESRRVVWSADGQSYDEISTITDGSGNLAKKTIVTYEKFSFGLVKVREQQVFDVSGNALVTAWDYYERINPGDPKPDGYGQVKSRRDPSGYWEIYSYSPAGDLIQTASQYLDAAFGDMDHCKIQRQERSTSNPVQSYVTLIQGQEVSRSYVVEFNETSTSREFERRTIICVTPGASWTAADNLVSSTRTFTSNHPDPAKRGKTKWTRRPDGVMTVYAYALSGGNKIVTTDSGASDSAFPAADTAATGNYSIVAGTRVVSTTNAAGQKISEVTQDLINTGGTPTLLTLNSWEALTVDAVGRPTLIGYGDGTTRSIAYVGSSAACGSCSGAGNFLVESETDRNGVITTYAYDALNRRTNTTRLGVTEHVIYDAADRVLERHRIGTDSSDIRLSKTVYDLTGRVVETYDALNNKTDYAYSYPAGGGLVTTITNPAATSGAARGIRVKTTYGDGRIKEISGTAVSPLKYAYGTWSATGQAGEWTQEIKVGDASAETEWTKTYTDFANRTVKQEYPATSSTVAATMAYNALGQLEKQTDADGVQTLFAYNAKGEREVTALDLDQDGVIDYTGSDRITKTVRDVYSRSGTIVSRSTTQVWATDGSNTTTTVSVSEQDGYRNASWQTDAAGADSSTAITRTALGAWTVTAIRPDGSRQVETYTSGRLISSAALSSSLSTISSTGYAYDAHNRVETQSDARAGDTDYTYTDRDEVLTVTANNGTETTTYGYDALGNQLTITRPDSSVTTNDYHLRNKQLKKTSGSQTYPVEYTYDLQGRMKTLTTWQNATSSTGAAITTWNYDAQRGWLTQKLYADNTGPGYTYKPSGRLLTRTWVRTVASAPLVTTYAYNNAGDLASTDYSDTTPDVAITYTRFGAQHTVTDATGTRTFTYTAALRADQEQLPAFYGNRILTRSYQVGLDLASTPSSVPGRNDGFELGVSGDLDQDYDVVYGYDTSGRLGTVTDPNGTYTYGYVTNSNLRHTVTGPVHVATTTYEPYRNMIDTVENTVGSNSVSKFDYTVNSLGQRTQRANTGMAFGATSTDVFTYNSKGEVESATNATLTTRDQSFAYDDIGNRKTFTQNSGTTSYTANSLNAYTAIGAVSLTQDEDGNQTSTGTGQVYIWDGENRLVLIEPVLPTTGDKKQLNVYDAQSRRVRKQVSTYASGSWSLTTDEKFIYDGWNLVAVLDAASSNALLRTYTWGTDLSGSLQGAGGVGGLLSAKDGGSVYHYTYDANGNVSEVLNSSGGGIAAHYEYDAFGNTVASSGTYATTNPYRFSTKLLDDVSSLYYYGLRYYKPSTGRWPSRDPIGERGGRNLYGFVNNAPTGYIDFLGLDPRSSSIGANGLADSAATGRTNCLGYAASGGGSSEYYEPTHPARGANKDRSIKEDMEAEGWSCEEMTGPTCMAPCDYEKMVVINYLTGNKNNKKPDGTMKDSFTDKGVQFGKDGTGGEADFHAMYSSSGCSGPNDYQQIPRNLPAGSKPESGVNPWDYNGKKYCCKRKKK